MQKAAYAILILAAALTAGCALEPMTVRNNSKRFPPAVYPIGRYQLIPPALKTPIGIAYGAIVERELRDELGSAVAPDSDYALYITDIEIKDEKRGTRLVIFFDMKAHVHFEPGSESRPVLRVDVITETDFEINADASKARESAARAAAAALIKLLP